MHYLIEQTTAEVSSFSRLVYAGDAISLFESSYSPDYWLCQLGICGAGYRLGA